MVDRNSGEFTMWNANLQVGSGRRLLALGIALLAAWLLVMAVAADASAGDDPVDVAANLVMAVATDTSAADDSAELAANPELAAAGRWSRSTGQSVAAAANPELAAAVRWSLSTGQQGNANFLAANPEVMAARRFSRQSSECGVALGC